MGNGWRQGDKRLCNANSDALSYTLTFKALSQNCEKQLSALPCPSVRPSVRPNEKARLPLDGLLQNF
jgi:hypothetical protein